MKKKTITVEVDGKELALSNLEKVFYPTGFTKAQVIQYYMDISSAILPHLKDRPLTLKRYPEGVNDMFFYEKNCPAYRPKWVRTAPVWSEGNKRIMDFCVVNDLASLIWVANLATLEMHTSLSVARDVERPTVIAFDLDPGPPANIIDCVRVAQWLRKKLNAFGLESFPKTSGSKGLQVYVPLNTATDYVMAKQFAHTIALELESEHPQDVVSIMAKAVRNGKVFVDWSQNDRHKTTVCVYSLRAKDRPLVSTPVTWQEVNKAGKQNDPTLLKFEAQDVVKRVDRKGDLFEPVLKLKQKLPKIQSPSPLHA
jgi:bifunctional non-homologous end joining protein LigD